MTIQGIQTNVQNVFQRVRNFSPSKILKAVLITAVALAAMQSLDYYTADQNSRMRINDCLTLNCPDIDLANVHPREKEATEVIYKTNNFMKSKFVDAKWPEVQEILRFNKNDPRGKALIAVAEHDHNKALASSEMSTFLGTLSLNFDIKYQVINDLLELCKSVKEGKKAGDMEHIFILAHGTPNYMLIDKRNLLGGLWNYQESISADSVDFTNCFSDLQPNGRIFLISCSTGEEQKGNPFSNIAQQIADIAKRVVIAPTNITTGYYTEFLSEDDVTIYHPKHLQRLEDGKCLPALFWDSNLYQAFRPQLKKCSPSIYRKKLTAYELAAERVIRTDLISRSLLHSEITFVEEYLQNCDDPREKVLVLAGVDNKLGWHPDDSVKVLSKLADQFDLRYKQVESFEEICKAVTLAAQFGKVRAVFIQSQGIRTNNGMILSKDLNGKEEQINTSNDFKQCFAKVDKTGSIIFMGGSLGKDGTNKNNIAQKVADETGVVVVAPTCPIFTNKIEIQSIKPLMLKHPPHSFIGRFRYSCGENNENLFKRFYPEKTKNS